MLKKGDKLLTGFCWIPKCETAETLRKIESIKVENKNVEIPTLKIILNHTVKPPTMFKTNGFTEIFQKIVDTYGVPNYKEVNPAVFTCVTFPFLFGIMFGDMGHGSVLLLVGIAMCLSDGILKSKFPDNAAIKGAMGIRYLVLLMGFFALFCGVMYNDFMSIPLFLTSSCYPI